MKLFNYVFSDRKKSLLVLLLALLSLSPAYAQQGYAVFDSSTGTLTFKYGTPTGTLYTDYYNTNIEEHIVPRWCTKKEITKVVFDPSFAEVRLTSLCCWFSDLYNLTTIEGIEYLNTENLTCMMGMFEGCRSLTSIDLSNFNTSKVNHMSYLFERCSSLTCIDLSNFNTASTTEMSRMFEGCSNLAALDLSNFETANLQWMNRMFKGCSSLTSLNLSNFDTANVLSMSCLFEGCSELTHLTFGQDFSTEKITSSSNKTDVFNGCPKLRYIDFFDSDDTDAITEVNRSSAMFNNVPQTTVIYLPHGSQEVTNVRNVVYSNGGDANDLWCPEYYSEDKVDIEFPRSFQANEAKYSRTMNAARKYGTTILPYAFESNDEVQAYTLHHELTDAMYFVEAATVPAHTPFFYKKKNASATTVNFNMADATDGITVNATHTTSAAEGGEPYQTGSGMTDWATKGYYITETITANNNGTFYISGDKFMKAMGTVDMYPHRVTFHGEWTMDPSTSNGSNIMPFELLGSGDVTNEIINALEKSDLRKEVSEARAIYDAQGRQHSELQKGLNIIRRKDGSAVKVVIR